MTEEQETKAGNDLIWLLGLRVHRTGLEEGRVDTAWGTKTPKGLWRTIKRFVLEAEMETTK